MVAYILSPFGYQLSPLPESFVYCQSDEECYSCLESLDGDSSALCHSFSPEGIPHHPVDKKCIEKWLKEHSECGCCRTQVSKDLPLSLKERCIKVLKCQGIDLFTGAAIGGIGSLISAYTSTAPEAAEYFLVAALASMCAIPKIHLQKEYTPLVGISAALIIGSNLLNRKAKTPPSLPIDWKIMSAAGAIGSVSCSYAYTQFRHIYRRCIPKEQENHPEV